MVQAWLDLSQRAVMQCRACTVHLCWPCHGRVLGHSQRSAGLTRAVLMQIELESQTSGQIWSVMAEKELVGRLVQEGKGDSAVQRLVSMEERWAYAYSMRKLVTSPFQVRH